MSELQDIAESVSSVAGEIAGVVQQLAAQAVRNRQTAAQATAVLAGSSDPRPKQVTQQLDAAAQRCEQAAQALQLAEQAAKQFVGRIVGGGGGGGGSGRDASRTESEQSGVGAGAQRFMNAALRTKGGVAFFGADDVKMRDSAHRVPDYPGEFVADLHGAPNRVELSEAGETTYLSAQEFAGVLRQTGWSGEPVRLFSCNTGADPGGFAQQLAKELGAPVTAPTAPVWAPSGWVGEGYLDDSEGFPVFRKVSPGEWRVFTP